jgi:hypothetical protein
MTASIVEGRQNIEQFKLRLRQDPRTTRQQLRVLGNALDTYYPAFVVEERAAGVIRLGLDSLPGRVGEAQATDADVRKRFEQIGAALGELAKERIALQQRRLEILNELR